MASIRFEEDEKQAAAVRAVQRVINGEIQQFAEIMRLYQGDVWKIVKAMLENDKYTEDLVQQVFMSAYHHLDQYDARRDFGKWIKEIARNTVRQELRRSVREKRRHEIYHEHLLARMKNSDEADSYEKEQYEALADCLASLPQDKQNLINLRYRLRLRFEEIASALSRKDTAVRQMVVRIRKILRDCIERKFIGYEES